MVEDPQREVGPAMDNGCLIRQDSTELKLEGQALEAAVPESRSESLLVVGTPPLAVPDSSQQKVRSLHQGHYRVKVFYPIDSSSLTP